MQVRISSPRGSGALLSRIDFSQEVGWDRHKAWNTVRTTRKFLKNVDNASILSGFVQDLADVGANFFCSRDYLGRKELKNIFPTLAYQLACRYPAFRSQLIWAIKWDTHGTELACIPTQGLDCGPPLLYGHSVRHRRGRPGGVCWRPSCLSDPLRPTSFRQVAAFGQVLHHWKTGDPHSGDCTSGLLRKSLVGTHPIVTGLAGLFKVKQT